MKRIIAVCLVLCLALGVFAGCGDTVLKDYGKSPKEIKNSALEIANGLGYDLRTTGAETQNSITNGDKYTSDIYTINDYLVLDFEGTDSEDYGDTIYITVYENLITDGDYDTPVDEWIALVYGVLYTIDPEADFDEFDAMFYDSDTVYYHDFYYYYYTSEEMLELTIIPLE
jgi:hypothetical protein